MTGNQPSAPAARVIVIRRSLEALVCGIFGFLPLLGVAPGLYALISWAHVRRRYPNEWTPAAAYLSWGARLSVLGLLGTALIIGVILVEAFG